MPKSLSNALIQAKNTLIQNNPWAFLVDIQYQITTAPTYGHFYLTNYSTTITYDSKTFFPVPLSIGQIEENSKGEINRLQVATSNMEPLLTEKLRQYWLNVASPLWYINLWIVDTSQPSETALASKETFAVITVTTTLLASTFECLWVGLGFERTVPGRRYTRTGGFPHIPRIIR